MKRLGVFSLARMLVGSLAINGMLYSQLREFPLPEMPDWSREQLELLNQAYSELAAQSQLPLGAYPYELEETDDGFVVRFSLISRVPILDGCIYYFFDKAFKLVEVFGCG